MHVESKYIPPSQRSLPALALQITQLSGSYMVWIGTTTCTTETVDKAAMQGSLLRDWACAMPPGVNTSTPAAATCLYRASSSDIALPMAQRLAKRFKKQIFLSVDIPPGFLSMGDGPLLVLAAEKAVVEGLKEAEEGAL
ncbi:hypothetical protein NLI96_g12970 [Meripilus lineatus]|uniref:Uncharacterized protein n=1 Tax=Meripilus lineatus TaxID=2056292 RepID=A0AAD5UQ80_9APHY|nr:hypothetical protein NLI96_g12970 [Physisporinus lineatus]